MIPANQSQNGPVLLHFCTGKCWEKLLLPMNHKKLTSIFFNLGSSLLLKQLQKMSLSEKSKNKTINWETDTFSAKYLSYSSLSENT